MAPRKKDDPPKRSRRKPPTTPEAQENEMISLAVELAKKQLREGTASSQVVTHYLKLGTTREQLEQQKLYRENRLLDAKVDAIESGKRIEALYEEALSAMKQYAGQPPVVDQHDD